MTATSFLIWRVHLLFHLFQVCPCLRSLKPQLLKFQSGSLKHDSLRTIWYVFVKASCREDWWSTLRDPIVVKKNTGISTPMHLEPIDTVDQLKVPRYPRNLRQSKLWLRYYLRIQQHWQKSEMITHDYFQLSDEGRASRQQNWQRLEEMNSYEEETMRQCTNIPKASKLSPNRITYL